MWYAKPRHGYSVGSTEGTANATEIASYLASKEYTLESICAILGNIGGEGGLNPWRWESDYVPTVSEFQNWTSEQAIKHGYGLVGFTPANRYINAQNESALFDYGYSPNFADAPGEAEDGLAQTVFFESEIEPTVTNTSGAWAFSYYAASFETQLGFNVQDVWNLIDYTFEQFKTDNTIPLEFLVGFFELKYEKPAAELTHGDTTTYPAADSYWGRVSVAQYYYNYFSENPIPGFDFFTQQHHLPIWMY